MTAKREILVADVMRCVAVYYRVKDSALRGPSKRRRVAHPRQIAMALAREFTGQSLAAIGRQFKRDHSTVYAAGGAVTRRAGLTPYRATELELLRLSLATHAAQMSARAMGDL